MSNQIEGVVEAGQAVVVIEDLVSTGKSSLLSVDALREASATVKGMLAILTYGLDIAEQNFEKANCELTTLTDFETLLKKAIDENYISDKDLKSLMLWRINPQEWSDKHSR